MEPTQYVVGLFIANTEDGVVWSFCGVFDNQRMAEEHCTLEHHFVAPAFLNEPLPPEIEEWEGCYYPRIDGRRV